MQNSSLAMILFTFDASFSSKREQMVTKNVELNVPCALTNVFYEHLPSEVSAIITIVLFR
jgi:hypothetical protein